MKNYKNYYLPSFLIIVPIIVVWPGLDGPLLLDDYWNLSPLLQESADYKTAIFENNAGPFGRSVTMTSFVINHWLREELVVRDLKLTNLFIHIANGLLLFYLLRQLLCRRVPSDKAQLYSFFISFLWLVNPVNTSTVLYVIQRSALLSATFMFAGLIAYVIARRKMRQSGFNRYYWFAPCLICWILAMFSKENAVLFPLYILVIELCFYEDLKPFDYFSGNRQNGWLLALLAIGCALLAFMFLNSTGYLNYESRIFSLEERIYTQPVVLVSYLRELLLPYKLDIGLYNDDYIIRATFWNPTTTISTVFLLILLIVSVLTLKKENLKYLGAGMLLFFSGHLLESTIFPLQLYFLHRNYFPSVGVFTALVLFSGYLSQYISLGRGVYLMPLIFAILLMQYSYRQSKIYASKDTILMNAFRNHPHSLRINLEMTGRLVAQGDLKTSLLINSQFIKTHPFLSLPAKIQRLYIYCQLAQEIPEQEYALFKNDINLNNPLSVSTAFYALLESNERNTCQFIDIKRIFTDLSVWIDAQLTLGSYTPERLWDMDYFVIEYLNSIGEISQALQRLQTHLALGNKKASYYRDVILPQRDK